jgi:hypothetical protein
MIIIKNKWIDFKMWRNSLELKCGDYIDVTGYVHDIRSPIIRVKKRKISISGIT